MPPIGPHLFSARQVLCRPILIAAVVAAFTFAQAAPAKELNEPTRVLKQGEKLADVAREFYGSPVYDLVIAKHNNVPNKEAVPVGAKVRVPDLGDVLVAEGIKQEMMDDVNALVKARYRYMAVRGDVGKLLAGSGPGKVVRVPRNVKEELEGAAQTIESAAKSLAKKGNYADSPTRLKNRLVDAATAMRKLASGRGDQKTDDSIHVLYAQAWVRAIMWVRGEDGA